MTLLILLTTLFVPAKSDALPVYTGIWKNNRAKTTGNLAVIVMHVGEHEWKAKFKGEFQGDPFDYEASFTTTPEIKKKKETGKLKIKGRASIDSQLYTLRGWMSDDTFYGRFSSSGPNGDFRLARQK